MTNKNYLRFRYYDIIGNFIACTVWFSLASYVVMIKSQLGLDLINILEAIITIVTLVGIKYGFDLVGKLSYSKMILIDNIVETLFLILFIYLVYIDSSSVGLSIYFVIMLNKFFNPFKKEKQRYIEDHHLASIKYKYILSDIRKRSAYSETLGNVAGIVITLIAINVLGIDIKIFVLCVISINTISNVFDYYKWNKYLR